MIRLEAVTPFKLASKLRVIENLTVEDDRMARVGAEDRLVTARDVNDAEPVHPEAEIAIREITIIIRTAVANPIARSDESALRHRLTAAPVPTRNSAHGLSWSRRLMATAGMNNKTGKPMRVWALLGPHRGDNNQVLALAEALGIPFEEKWLRFNQLRRLQPALLGATLKSVAAEVRSQLEGEPPDLTISTGHRSVPVVRALKERSGGKMRAVHLGYPRISPAHFDLVAPTPGISGARCAERRADPLCT